MDPSINDRKIRLLIITMGGRRKEIIEEMFIQNEILSKHFSVEFSPGVPVRSIKTQKGLWKTANDAKLFYPEEWEQMKKVDFDPDILIENYDKTKNYHKNRKGRKIDLEVPYCLELWRKSKGLSRQRSVLACSLAHLIAIRKHIEKINEENGNHIGYDIILEDNVRPILSTGTSGTGTGNDDGDGDSLVECVQRIRDTIKSSQDIKSEFPCHMRYFGWLGSMKNVAYVYNQYFQESSPQSQTTEEEEEQNLYNKLSDKIFAYPTTAHDGLTGSCIWGAFAYWISPEAYHNCLIPTLRDDVGSMLWKGKRMKTFCVKPIDKILPRKIVEYYSTNRNVHVTTVPAFYRAPMLTSTIHTVWDKEFCKSTEVQFQMQEGDEISWNNLWLTEQEQINVQLKDELGGWDNFVSHSSGSEK